MNSEFTLSYSCESCMAPPGSIAAVTRQGIHLRLSCQCGQFIRWISKEEFAQIFKLHVSGNFSNHDYWLNKKDEFEFEEVGTPTPYEKKWYVDCQFDASPHAQTIFDSGSWTWNETSAFEMHYGLYEELSTGGYIFPGRLERKSWSTCDPSIYDFPQIATNHPQWIGHAGYEKIENPGIFPEKNQKLHLKNCDIELDQFQNGFLMSYLAEYFHERNLKIWRWPWIPNEKNSFGLNNSDWVVEVHFAFRLTKQENTPFHWILQNDEWLLDQKICRKFADWEDAKVFYEQMRSIDLRNFEEITNKFKVRNSKSHSQKQRQTAYSNGDAGINWQAVGEVFNWVCCLCGGECNRRAGTHLNPQGATVEHLMPISLGGPHTWDNVQCAHWECNIRKNNRL